MDERAPTFRNFIAAIRAHWLEAMSGAFSVPFSAAAVYSPEVYQKVIFGILALAAIWFAAYRVWAAERIKFIAAQSVVDELSKPNFKIEISHAITGEVTAYNNMPCNGSHALFSMSVTNLGTPAAIVGSSWSLLVETETMVAARGHPFTIVDKLDLKFDDGKRIRRFVREDALDLRASTAIERLGYKDGVLRFIIPTVPIQYLQSEKTKFILSCKDVTGATYTGDITFAALRDKSGETAFISNLAFPNFLPGEDE